MRSYTGKRIERPFMNKIAAKRSRNEYMKKAQDIGSNAIRLVNDFFSDEGVADNIDYLAYGVAWCYDLHEWTLTDLDRALDEMGRVN